MTATKRLVAQLDAPDLNAPRPTRPVDESARFRHENRARPWSCPRETVGDGSARFRRTRARSASKRPHGPDEVSAGRLALRDAGLERGAERVAHRLELDAVEHVLEEAAHDQALGLLPARARGPSGRRAARGRPGRPSRRACSGRRSPGSRDRGSAPRASSATASGCGSPGTRSSSARPLDADHPAPDRRRLVAQRALEGEVRGRVRRDVLLERVVVEVLLAVREVRAGHARGRARAGEVVLDPDLALASSRSRRRPSRAPRRARRARGATRSATSRARGSGSRRTRASPPARRRARRPRSCSRRARATRRVLLDQREAGALLGDDEQPEEERAALDRVRDADVERLLELDARAGRDEQAVLPRASVVRGELLVPADERAERGRARSSGSKRTPSGARSISIPASLTGPARRRRRRASAGPPPRQPACAVRGERVRVEAAQVGEAPVLVASSSAAAAPR